MVLKARSKWQLIIVAIPLLLSGCANYFPSLSPPFPKLNQPMVGPSHCQPVNVSFKSGRLLASRPKSMESAVLLIGNHSGQDIVVDRDLRHRSASAGWASELKSKRWSALYWSAKPLKLMCTSQAIYNKWQRVSCQSLLQACWLPVKEQKKNSGGYWVAENLRLKTLMQAIRNRGFVIQGQ
jgi:hypothetical protein